MLRRFPYLRAPLAGWSESTGRAVYGVGTTSAYARLVLSVAVAWRLARAAQRGRGGGDQRLQAVRAMGQDSDLWLSSHYGDEDTAPQPGLSLCDNYRCGQAFSTTLN